MSHLLFHRLFVFHHSRCDPALSVFAAKCPGECYASRLLSVISGILAGGIPGFRSELCCFYHPLAGMALCMLVFSPFCLCLRPYHDVMTQGCHLLHESANELVASHSSFVGCFLFCFCVVLVVCSCRFLVCCW